MAIESKNLLVWVKAMSRGQALPLDATEIYNTYEEAALYASSSAIAYPGQTIKALTSDGTYHTYTLQPSTSGYTLEEVGAINESDLKQYVMVVTELPTTGQEEGVLYINTSDDTGSIWTGSAWKEVIHNVQVDIDQLSEKVSAVETALDNKAPIANPVFTGTVKVGEDEVALKSYVEGLFANLTSSAPGVVDSSNQLPTADYKAGQTFRVAEDGTYAGVACEVGDLIMVVADYNADTASDADFMVIQANIDGAVTSTAETSTIGEIVVFDAVTGKVIKGSGIQIASLSDVISKAHEHNNLEVLNTYDKSQSELLAAAKSTAQGLVDELSSTVNATLDGKADAATTIAGYGITDAYTKTEIDSKLTVITDNLNTKVTASEVDAKIATAKTETLSEAASAASEALENRVGSISSEITIKEYIDTAVGSGGTSAADAIAAAKTEAIETANDYTDEQITSALTIVEF